MPEVSDGLTALQKIAAAQTAPAVSFNTELVRSAWSAIQRRHSEARRAARRSLLEVSDDYDRPMAADPIECCWIDQVWTDHLIVRLDGVGDEALRVPYTVEAPGTSADHVKFGQPEKVRMAYVAASGPALTQVVELSKRVRTMAGARRYRKPIGTQYGTGAPGGDTVATVAKTGSREGSGATADKLRSAIKDVSREKSYKGGDVFGDIGSEGKLKSALGQIERLPDGKRGAAAAEVVKAAQALGLTALVPSSVKRLYRQYIAQGPIKSPSKAPKSKDK
jgi:hypothetical protein